MKLAEILLGTALCVLVAGAPLSTARAETPAAKPVRTKDATATYRKLETE